MHSGPWHFWRGLVLLLIKPAFPSRAVIPKVLGENYSSLPSELLSTLSSALEAQLYFPSIYIASHLSKFSESVSISLTEVILAPIENFILAHLGSGTESLRMVHHHLTDDTFIDLSKSAAAGSLRKLNCSSCSLTDSTRLCWRNFTVLRTLRLESNYVSLDTIAEILNLPSLTSLDFCGDDRALAIDVARLISSQPSLQLEELSLQIPQDDNGDDLGTVRAALDALGPWRGCSKLRVFSLGDLIYIGSETFWLEVLEQFPSLQSSCFGRLSVQNDSKLFQPNFMSFSSFLQLEVTFVSSVEEPEFSAFARNLPLLESLCVATDSLVFKVGDYSALTRLTHLRTLGTSAPLKFPTSLLSLAIYELVQYARDERAIEGRLESICSLPKLRTLEYATTEEIQVENIATLLSNLPTLTRANISAPGTQMEKEIRIDHPNLWSLPVLPAGMRPIARHMPRLLWAPDPSSSPVEELSIQSQRSATSLSMRRKTGGLSQYFDHCSGMLHLTNLVVSQGGAPDFLSRLDVFRGITTLFLDAEINSFVLQSIFRSLPLLCHLSTPDPDLPEDCSIFYHKSLSSWRLQSLKSVKQATALSGASFPSLRNLALHHRGPNKRFSLSLKEFPHLQELNYSSQDDGTEDDPGMVLEVHDCPRMVSLMLESVTFRLISLAGLSSLVKIELPGCRYRAGDTDDPPSLFTALPALRDIIIPESVAAVARQYAGPNARVIISP